MGVIYKLKDDVVQFILQQKQENPNISCRKLVNTIQESFQISVSKSSINTIIKDAHLSNPIGRAPRQAKTPAFKIPQEKKSELLRKTKLDLEEALGIETPTLEPKNVLLPPIQTRVQSEEVSQEINPPLPAVLKVFPDPSDPEETCALEDISANAPPPEPPEDILVSLLPDPLTLPLLEVLTQNNESQFDITSLGNVLLRAALWDLSRRPILETFLKHQTDLTDEEIKIIDILLCFVESAFEVPVNAISFHNLWIWKAVGFEMPPLLTRLERLIDRIKTIQVDGFDFQIETSYFFEFVSRIQICLPNHKIIGLDARTSRLTQKAENSCPIDHAIENISQFMTQRDNHSVLYCSLPECFTEFKDFIGVCECLPNKEIVRIILLDQGGRTMSEFNAPPILKRKYFITALLSTAQIRELFGVAVTLPAKNTFQNENHTVYWAQYEVEIGDMETGRFHVRMTLFSKNALFDEAWATFTAVADSMSLNQIYDLLLDSQSQTNEQLAEIHNECYLPDNSSKNLKECLETLKSKIWAYALAIFHHPITKKEFIRDEQWPIKAVIGNGVITLKEFSNNSLQRSYWNKLTNIINNYRICNYQQKPLKFIINNRQLD